MDDYSYKMRYMGSNPPKSGSVGNLFIVVGIIVMLGIIKMLGA